MSVLLDTCILNELRRPDGHPAVKAAVDGLADDSLFLSVLTVGEIVKGVAHLADGPKRRGLIAWLNELENRFAGRILTVDRETAALWGEVTARSRKVGVVIPPVDGLIAATALRYNMRVMTRNTRDFRTTGVPVLDPWTD